ncbi:hypothetical protein E3N88_14455 [Mikania micrantha]|uniref:Uncharacterized protein n=1 Tax=Mikania micrantha TaxID=192012 RepID=A0A5N6P4J5_9ASTR|nr:hypothetical protein E3N88_14455 [Mikania micrantha]
MARNRTPQFPGSIYVQSPADISVESSLPAIKTVFNGEIEDSDYDYEVIMRALEIRREVTLEIFKEAMRKGKFGLLILPIWLQDCSLSSLIMWLKHNGLSYPQIGKLICNSKGNIESIRSTAEWLKSIHVNGRYIGVALLRGGEKVLERNVEELDEILWVLEKNGVKREWMGYIVSRCPELLTFSMEEFKTYMILL